MAKVIRINKIYRKTPIIDLPPNFNITGELFLDMLENKKKLKKGLPLIPRKPKNKTTLIENKSGILTPVKTLTNSKPVEPVKKKSPVKKIPDEIQEIPPELVSPDSTPSNKILDDFQDDEKNENTNEQVKNEDEDESPEDDSRVEIEEEEVEEMSPEEKEYREKRKYLRNFRILKKKYKNREDIPDFSEHTDLSIMKATYDSILEDINLDNSVDTYSMYLYGGFAAIEWFFTQWVQIDFTGFAKEQAKQKEKYDKLLIELGERPYNVWGSNLPVEIKLLGFVLLNAAFFYIGKLIGTNIMDIFSSGNKINNVTETKKKSPKKQKRKMRGPKKVVL